MKKILSLFVVFSFVLFLAGCSDNKLQKTFELLDSANSYTMEISIANMMSATIKVDGDITQTNATVFFITVEEYLEVVGDTTYLYEKDLDGAWTKMLYNEEDAQVQVESAVDPKNLKADWFEKKDDAYVLKAEYYDDIFAEEAEAIENVKITINNDGLTMNISMDADGMKLAMEIVVNKINETTVTLPEATLVESTN